MLEAAQYSKDNGEITMFLLAVWLATGVDREVLIRSAQTTPDWLLWTFALVVMGLFLFGPVMLYVNLLCTRAMARKVASRKWHVREMMVFEPASTHWLDSKGWQEKTPRVPLLHKGAVKLELFSRDSKRTKLVLLFHPNHPSRDLMRQLQYLQILEFEFMERPAKGMLMTDICAYLRVKP